MWNRDSPVSNVSLQFHFKSLKYIDATFTHHQTYILLIHVSVLHVHAAGPRCMFICPCCLFMLHVHTARLRCISMLFVYAVRLCCTPCCMFILHVHVSTLHVHVASPCWTSMLHPCMWSMPMLRVHVVHMSMLHAYASFSTLRIFISF